MLMGLRGGLNDWFLWQLFYNFSVLQLEEAQKQRPQQQALLCNCCACVPELPGQILEDCC